MHIVNAMFGKSLGGIEQAQIDYCQAIKAQGHKVTALIHPQAKIRPHLTKLDINIVNVNNFTHWDIFAKQYIKKILHQLQPNAIITHGTRAVELLYAPAKTLPCPVIGVTHNYSIKRLTKLDAIIATTNDLKLKVQASNYDPSKIYHIPNMIRIPTTKITPLSFHKTPVIGTMGRFVQKKGFDVFLQALANLKQSGIKFSAIIGGSGQEENSLKELHQQLKLEDTVKFTGWVKDQQQFFQDIDIFCLPSHHEPFGIILLEAFANNTPVITTNSEGPSEIATNEHDALITEKNNPNTLALAITQLINNQDQAKQLSTNALSTIKKYDINTIGQQICEMLAKTQT